MKILVTGGSGFIGSNFVRHMLQKYKEIEIINLDSLTYAGNSKNLSSLNSRSNYLFIKGDIRDKDLVEFIFKKNIHSLINFAAESHVDRSITNPKLFLETNILGTQVLLEAAKKHGIERFIQISTDEVYGTLGDTGMFSEETNLSPNSPYSASKASADLLVRSYNKTYNLPTIITRCSNNYGPYQHPEKLIPLIITKALKNIPIPIYGDGSNVRDWLHVSDHCEAIDLVLNKGRTGEVYNIGGSSEMSNLMVVKMILRLLNKGEDLITFVVDRKGHDKRYAVDFSKIKEELGWVPKLQYMDGIKQTISWYIENELWWK
ncbi:dTDP-glucose 4,6-dehydratase [Sutcliffiella horikoshii]|uniref:dTDP-glucose 4,6-dehydratase n=1 Tax=Sutcliffiella horikoshii TaxID=79883 RepID=UPI002041B12C|nr:dTDP-glucose 4,6-dehydratase [Sutcliffiella horikoshii]MCM3616824.1 dTDP-glucose 4,6-dehydratase [Sutcliffiella horikoshii]